MDTVGKASRREVARLCELLSSWFISDMPISMDLFAILRIDIVNLPNQSAFGSIAYRV